MKSNKITNKDLMSLFWRSFLLPACYSMDRMQAPGFAYSIMPVLKKLYKGDKLAEALYRHSEVYNTTFAVSPFILGITTAMEEGASQTENFDTSSINTVKVALMGPLAGIGDTFLGTFRIIGSGIGTSLALQGNLLGPLLFLIIYNVPNFLVRYYGVKMGYRLGANSIDTLIEGGLMNKATQAAGVLGLTVVGGMIASLVNIELAYVADFGETTLELQSVLDEIVPKILPLTLTFVIYKMLQKNVKPQWIMFGIILLGIVGKFLEFCRNEMDVEKLISQEQLRHKIKTNEIKIYLQKDKPVKDYIEKFETIRFLKYLLLLPYVLPIMAVLVIFIVTGDIRTLLVVPCYLFIPIILGKSQIFLGGISILGFYAISKQWTPFYIALLLPAVLCNVGYLIYRRVLEFLILKRIMNNWDDAVELEREGFAVFTQEGNMKKLHEID